MNEKEQADLVLKSSTAIISIAQRYEMADENGLAAITEAVQTGLAIASNHMKQSQRKIIVGEL